MNRKRLAALGLSLALTLSLSVTPALALRFTDVPESFWGYSYISRMSNDGLAKGYGDGTFKPNRKMTAAETLLFCARATGVSQAVQTRIAQARKEEVAAILPSGMISWAADEMAVAVESGVLSLAELEALSKIDPQSEKKDASGKLNSSKTYLEEAMRRETIAMYLVRAMQLEPLAKSLSSYSLSYPDANQISPALRPYVYVLTQYGIVNGMGNSEGTAPVFDPQGSVTRAQMTAMLCRALDFMKKSGITAELPAYTDYNWVSGTISAVAETAGGGVAVTLTSPLTDTSQAYTLPSGVRIYDDNMLTTVSALKRGQFARLNLSGQGTVDEVRLSGVLVSYHGSVASLEEDRLSLLVDGQTRNFILDRFTSVAVGSEVGDKSLADAGAGYTTATAYVDEMGHLAAVRFNGGAHLVQGLIAAVTPAAQSGKSSTSLDVAAYSGIVTRYAIPDSAVITVNGIPGALNALSHIGKAVRLRVSADDGAVVSVAVDTLSKYIQGPIKRAGLGAAGTGTAYSLTITDRFTGKDYVYPIFSEAVITYDGKALDDVKKLEAGWYVSAVISSEIYTNDVITRVDAFPGTLQVTGVLSEIVYGSPTLLRVSLPDGSVSEYRVEVNDIPPIVRNGKDARITDLLTGDTVALTIRYHELERIEATAPAADLTGTITELSRTTAGTTMTVAFPDGSSKTYTVPSGISVTQNGSLTTVSALQPGAAVALVTKGEEIIAIDITAPAASSTRLSGTVYTVTRSGLTRTLELLIPDRRAPVKVDVGAQGIHFEAKGSRIDQSDISSGDFLEIYGEYDSTGVFVAWLVVKL